MIFTLLIACLLQQEIQRLIFGGVFAGSFVLCLLLIGFWMLDPDEIILLLIAGRAFCADILPG